MTDIFTTMLRTHQWIYENTGGLLGHRLLFGKPALLLHTTGRRTGRSRTNALLYVRDGDTLLVVASNGGAPQGPGWLANLKANSDCEIQIGRRRFPGTAHPTLPDNSEYARRWTKLNAVNNGRYTAYQRKTQRTIPIVELRPR